MGFNLFHVITLLSLALVGSHAVTPEVYWKSVLPNSPMPQSLKDLLYTTGKRTNVGVGKGFVGMLTSEGPDANINYRIVYAASNNQLKDDPNVTLFFLEKNLKHGEEMNLHFTKSNGKSAFLPRKVADSIPFSLKNLPEIYTEFEVKPESTEAEIMKQTLTECENKGIEGEEKYCATSLESMVDFSTTKLGKNVKAISTEVNAKESTPLQRYKIEVAKKLAANKAVVCHKQNYAYAVFYCHKIGSTRAYTVSLVGVDGTKVKAVAICHTDTAKWNPKHLAFQVLKVKPGSVPVCHFLDEENVVWVPY